MPRTPIATPDRITAITQANEELRTMIWLLDTVAVRPDGCVSQDALRWIVRHIEACNEAIGEALG